MRWKSYSDYLNSEQWSQIRTDALERDKNECYFCESTESLNVHHFKYSPDWNDDSIDNVVTLCKKCHSNHHIICNSLIDGIVQVNSVDDFYKLCSLISEALCEGYQAGERSVTNGTK
jgi:hypothetical protein